MKKLVLLITSVFIAFGTAAADEAEIRALYKAFDKAMLAEEFDSAFQLLGKESQELINEIRELANTAEKATLSKEPLSVLVTVFSVRKTAGDDPIENGPETLKAMGAQYARSSDMTSLGEVTLNGEKASGEMLMNNKASGVKFAFIEEDGEWKFDMATQLESSEELMKQSGMKKEDLIDQMAQGIGSDQFDPWQPIE